MRLHQILVLLGVLCVSTLSKLNPGMPDEATIEQDRNKQIPQEASTEQQEQPEINPEDNEDRVQIMEEWETLMKDFVPDEMLTFEVASRSEEIFIEDIKIPTLIRGAYFVSYNSDEKIDFSIRDPKKKRTLQKINKREGIFSFNATAIGEYEFVFSNLRGKEKKAVTFAVDIHNTTETHLSLEDLDPVEKKLEVISIGIKDYVNEQRFDSRRQVTQMESIQVVQKRLMILSIVEALIIAVATAWQVYYIKKILDNKRIV